MIKSELRKLIGEDIKDLRIKRGYSQVELSKELGHKSAAYISFIENGERNISGVDLVILYKLLRASVDKIYKK
jgi:transcriptional regulator with XRE-family HTH domain